MLTTNRTILIFILLVLAAGSVYWYQNNHPAELTAIPTPTPFTSDNVIIDSPLPGSLITSPLIVRGKAKGTWFFEASFPVKLLDANGNVIAVGPAQAQSDWMTTDFVPFEITLSFTKPTSVQGTLKLEKDNPSGLPEHDDSVSIPIFFSFTPPSD